MAVRPLALASHPSTHSPPTALSTRAACPPAMPQVHQGRGQQVDASAGQEYHCRLDALELRFSVFSTHVLVTHCELSLSNDIVSYRL